MKLFYVNGVARSGKDTVVNIMHGEFSRVHSLSSINAVKEICIREFGWNGEKDEKGRALLSDIKQAWVKYNDGPFNEMLKIIKQIGEQEEQLKQTPENLVFIMMREASEIQKMIDAVGGYALLVERPGIEADKTEAAFLKANKGFKYDITILNDGTLDELRGKTIETMQKVINGDTVTATKSK